MSIYDRIDEMPDDRVLEAVNLVSGDLLGPTPDDEVRANVAAAVGAEPEVLDRSIESSTPKQVADLGRVVLIAAVADGREREVGEALDEVGQKALLIEIVVIGMLALGALHTLRTRGRKEEVREQTVTVEPDGKITVKTTESVRYYSVGESLAPFAETLVKAALPS
jgi:hypothetical protein